MTLTEFLLARIADDEAAAKAATPGPWFTVAPHGYDDSPDLFGRLVSTSADWREYGDYVTPAGGEHGDDGVDPASAEHVARHDPSRVLAECAAKRRIVGEHSSEDDPCPDGYIDRVVPGECLTVRALAAVYADHPDYEEAWRP